MKKTESPEPCVSARQRPDWDLVAIASLAVIAFLFSARYDLLERLTQFLRQHEAFELDEILIVGLLLTCSLSVSLWWRLHLVRITESRLALRNVELEQAMADVKQLRGIIPICSACKKIRGDDNCWHHFEAYIKARSAADFSHGICPTCAKSLYPDIFTVDVVARGDFSPGGPKP